MNGEVLLHLLSLAQFAEQNLHQSQAYYNRKAICELQEVLQASFRGCVLPELSIPKYLISMGFEQIGRAHV